MSDSDEELLGGLESTGGDKGFPWTVMRKAATRIRELKEDYQEAINQMIEAKLEKEDADKRIAELKAALQFLTDEFDRVYDGVRSGTHVVVPVEPSMDHLKAGALAYEDARNRGYTMEGCMKWAHTAMIRAAKEQEP